MPHDVKVSALVKSHRDKYLYFQNAMADIFNSYYKQGLSLIAITAIDVERIKALNYRLECEQTVIDNLSKLNPDSTLIAPDSVLPETEDEDSFISVINKVMKKK